MVSPSWPIEQIDVSLPTLVTLARRPPSSPPPPSVPVSDCEAGSPGLWWHSRKTCLWSWMASAGEARQGHSEVGEQWCRFDHTTIGWPQSLNQWCHFVEERESLAGVLICLGFMEENKRIALRWSSRTKGICIGLGNPKSHLALDHWQEK